ARGAARQDSLSRRPDRLRRQYRDARARRPRSRCHRLGQHRRPAAAARIGATLRSARAALPVGGSRRRGHLPSAQPARESRRRQSRRASAPVGAGLAAAAAAGAASRRARGGRSAPAGGTRRHAQRRQPAETAVLPDDRAAAAGRAADERAPSRRRCRRPRRHLSDHARAVLGRLCPDHDLLGAGGGRRHRRHRGDDVSRPRGGALRARDDRDGAHPCRHHPSGAGDGMTAGPPIAGAGPAPHRARARRSHVPAVPAAVPAGLAASALATPRFLSQPSVLSLLTTVSFIGCVAVGMTLITISGNIMSFALGALTGATAMIFILAVNWGGFVFGLVAALVFAGAANAAQGVLVGWLRANPILVSIAALALLYGVAEAFAAHGANYAAAGTSFGGFKGKLAGVPVEFVVLLAVTALAQFILSFTAFGRHLFLIGASLRAAEAVGIRTWRAIAGAYLWAGLFTAP